jgi:hypothetical protein
MVAFARPAATSETLSNTDQRASEPLYDIWVAVDRLIVN